MNTHHNSEYFTTLPPLLLPQIFIFFPDTCSPLGNVRGDASVRALLRNNLATHAMIGLAAWSLSAWSLFVLAPSYNEETYVFEGKSIATLREKAEQGDVESQYWLGFVYGDGDGVQKDLAESLKWTKLAAEQGHAKAQYNLAWFYDKGEIVPEDIPEAMRWLRLSAEQGLADAMDVLGYIYDVGEDVEEDEE